jgi:hypothetical protein
VTTTYDANDVLMGGAGSAAWKFDEPGTTHEGTIASPPQARQEREYDPNNPGGGALKVFPSGDPIMGVVVEVQTTERDPSNREDDGRRTFYIEGRYIKEAVKGAVRAAGAAGLEVGGKLSVTFTHREDPMDKRSRKFWQVTYTPAGNAALMGQPATPAQAAPPAYTTPVQQQAAPVAYQQPPAAPAQVAAQPTAPVGFQSEEQAAAFAQWQASQGIPQG